MTYQHEIMPTNAVCELRVEPEVHGRVCVKYRIYDQRFAHRGDWRPVDHCTPGEAQDVAMAVVDGFLADLEAQGLF